MLFLGSPVWFLLLIVLLAIVVGLMVEDIKEEF